MKAYFKIIAFILLGLFYFGCNSTMYEIVEVEEPVEIKPEKTSNNDIKEEISEEPKVTENKFTDKQMISKTFAIQIGAFNEESNASRFTDKARKQISNSEIYFKDIDGLFKVRLGNFSSKSDAMTILEELQAKGFNDSFIVELTYYKVENK
jgi:cell division septation protein DedD